MKIRAQAMRVWIDSRFSGHPKDEYTENELKCIAMLRQKDKSLTDYTLTASVNDVMV